MKLVDRKTGALVDVPDDQAAALFKSGMYGIPQGATMPIKTQMGIVGSVDPTDASLALERKGTVPSEAEFRQAELERKYGGLGGEAAAAGVGAARGFAGAFGVPLDAAATSLAGTGVVEGRDEVDPYEGRRHLSGADVTREALRGLQEANPKSSFVGELAGIGGAAALGGGIMGGAGAAAEGAGEALGLGRLGAGALRGAAEGAVLSVPQQINEADLGDTELNAEKVIGGMGMNAFLGAGLGAAFSGLGLAKDSARDAVGRYIGKLAPKDVEALAEKAFGYAPEGLGQRVQKAFSKLSAGVAGKDAEVVDRLTALTPEGAEARRVAVFDAPKIQDEAERNIRGFGDAMLRAEPQVSELARGDLKKDFIDRTVKRGNEAEVSRVVTDRVTGMLDGIDAELTHAHGVAPQYVKSLESLSTMGYRALEALEGGNGDAYFAVDQLKRAGQRISARGTAGIRSIADPVERLNAERALDFFKDQSEGLRGLLEDEGLWGKPATAQKDVNAAWTRQIEAQRRFNKALTTDVGRSPDDPYDRLTGIDPGKLQTYTRQLTNPNQDLTHAAVKDYAASTRDLVDAVKKHYELGPEQLKAVDDVHRAATGFGKELDRAGKALSLANQYRALTEGTTDSLSALLGTVGGVVGGLPGGVVGAAAGAVANPGRVVAQLAAAERLITKVDTRIGSSIRDFFAGRSRRIPAPHEARTPEGFDKMTKILGECVDADGNVTPAGQERIGDAIGELGTGAPNLAAAVGMKASIIAGFLASKLPVGMRNPNDMFPGDEPPLVSDTERETFARYVAAAEDPMSVVDHLAHGDVTPEEADVLKACYPRLYEQVRGQIDQALQHAQAKGKPLGYERKVSYGVLFAVRTDATMDPQVLTAVATAQAGHRGKKGGGMGGGMRAPTRLRGAPNMAARFETTFQSAGSRRKGGLL